MKSNHSITTTKNKHDFRTRVMSIILILLIIVLLTRVVLVLIVVAEGPCRLPVQELRKRGSSKTQT